MGRLALLLGLLLLAAGCADEAPPSAPPTVTMTVSSNPTPTRPSVSELQSNFRDQTMTRDAAPYVPAGFPSVRYGQEMCSLLDDNYTPAQILGALGQLGFSQDNAFRFATLAAAIYCPNHSSVFFR